MPSAGNTSRSSRDVFHRLNNEPSGIFDYHRHNVVSGPNKGQVDLQYPDNLGGDEYNQFVMFTMFEKTNAEIVAATKAVQTAKQELDADSAKEVNELAKYIADQYLHIDDSGAVFDALKFTLNTGATIADLGSEALAALGIMEEDETWQAIVSDQETIAKYNAAQKNYNEAKDKFKKSFYESSETEINQFSEDRSNTTIENARLRGLNIGDRTNSINNNRVRISSATSKVDTTIALYIPNKIVNNGSLSYNGVDFSLARALSGTLQRGQYGDLAALGRRGIASFFDSLTNIIGTNLNAEQAMQAVSGLAINPRQEMLFNGVQVRTFDFTFSFAPRNKGEAQTTNQIIREFRKYAHPSLHGTGAMLNVPAEFEIRYYKVFNNDVTAENLFLNKIGRCALTAVNVDYTPNAVMSTFPDGSPVRTSLTMSFQELRPLTREDIEEGY